MKGRLRGVGKLFTAMCTALVVLAGLTYVVGKVVGVPVRVTYQTVAGAALPEAQQPAPALPRRGGQQRGGTAPVGTPLVQNVIFFVGDGMGLSMLAAVDALAERRLAMVRMPVTGLVRTASLSGLITDSAAGATAFATGHKTTNGTVAMTPEGQRLPTILEAAAAQGFATGLVTTSYLTDATPAAFAAHARSRHDARRIARQMVASQADVLIGGTQAAFTDSLRRAARQQRFAVASTLGALASAPPSARWLGLFPERAGLFDKMHGPPMAQTLQAVLGKMHRRGRRFFLMIEQEGTDAAGHTNRLQDARAYLRELDRAVARALRFAARSGGHTLVLVTADHDTGGLSITEGNYENGRATARWNEFGHTATWVPLLAYGPGAGRFTGVQENTALPVTMARLLGLEGFLERNAQAMR